MDLPPANAIGGAVTRRQALRLIGGAGLAASVEACSNTPKAVIGTTAPSSPTTQELQRASVSTVPPVPKPNPATLLCRNAWGARPPRPGGQRHTVNRLTLHHSGVILGDNKRAPSRLRQHQRYHQDSHGWIDIAYHVSVDRNGHIYELRAPQLSGDTATDYETAGHFLVVCEGDFDKELLTEAQIHSTAVAFAWAAQTFGVAPSTLAGHRDIASSACPGANLYERVSSGELLHRIEALLAGGGVTLEQLCGPAAVEIVDAIESGQG
ncbi:MULTISPECIES: peptidoglycan recognition family protein [Mycobacteriaceae]|uniref:peptidoglycan recognition protein family protein n=1 Tax=Mycobacteriaceae TaxID=1762 RepID=UPI001BB2F971|nr:peptidoglycan recognition family protein [Mycolicibacterium sp. TY66]